MGGKVTINVFNGRPSVINSNAASESLNSLWNTRIFKWLCSYRGMYVRTDSFTQLLLDTLEKLLLAAFK